MSAMAHMEMRQNPQIRLQLCIQHVGPRDETWPLRLDDCLDMLSYLSSTPKMDFKIVFVFFINLICIHLTSQSQSTTLLFSQSHSHKPFPHYLFSFSKEKEKPSMGTNLPWHIKSQQEQAHYLPPRPANTAQLGKGIQRQATASCTAPTPIFTGHT